MAMAPFDSDWFSCDDGIVLVLKGRRIVEDRFSHVRGDASYGGGMQRAARQHRERSARRSLGAAKRQPPHADGVGRQGGGGVERCIGRTDAHGLRPTADRSAPAARENGLLQRPEPTLHGAGFGVRRGTLADPARTRSRAAATSGTHRRRLRLTGLETSGGLASESNGGLTRLHPRCVAPPPPGRQKEHDGFTSQALRSRNQARLLLAKP